jgi:hypothetical protein
MQPLTKIQDWTFILNAFGLNANDRQQQAFTTQELSMQHEVIGTFDNAKDISTDYYDHPVSVLGTHVFDTLKIDALNYYDTESSRTVYASAINILPVLFNADQGKNIVKTEVQGRSGTVKEYIALGDYTMSCKGVLTSQSGPKTYPKDEANNLIAMLNAPVALTITGKFINHFGSSWVVDRYSLEQKEGYPFMLFFSIDLISDTDFVIETTQNA